MSADQPDYDFIEAQERGYDEAERRREEIDRLRSRIMELEKALGPIAVRVNEYLADMSEPADGDAFSMLLPWKDFRTAARVLTEGRK